MVALLIGGESRLMDTLINKLNKDGHRVYLLTGRRDKKHKYPRVFERYDFTYDSEGIKAIFRSLQPDIVVFTGAFDTNYNWENARKDSVRYTADLSNILAAFSISNKGRFFYLSSQEIFGKSYVDNIPEEEKMSATGFRSLAIYQGEELCSNYHITRSVDARVLRLDHLYGIPKKNVENKDPCFEMTLQMLKTSTIEASRRRYFSMLYIDDAVEFIAQVLTKEEPEHTIYHISSGNVISQMELAELIQKAAGREGIRIMDATVGEKYRLVLSRSRFEAEFNGKVFVAYEAGVKQVVQFMKRHSDSYLKAEDTGGGIGNRIWHSIRTLARLVFPFIENMIVFIPFFMLNNRAVSSPYFNKLDFYLLYVLLFAIVYGQQQAIFSSLLATGGYCFRQMYDQTGLDVLQDYNTYVWMAQLFILGMIVGYMRDRIGYIKNEDEEEMDYLNGQLEDITDINDSNVRIKQTFERQIVNQKDSLGKIYDIASSLDQYAPEEVLFYAARVLSQLMDTKDVAIYTVANQRFARLFSFTSNRAKKLGNSIEYPNMEQMYEDLKEHRVYINKTMDETYPLMAAAVYTDDDEIQTIFMLWGIPWERMNLAESNRLTVVGYLIHNAVMRSRRYMEALKNERYLEDTNILDTDAFLELVKAFTSARKNGLTECALIKVTESSKGKKKTARKLGETLRQTDYFGIVDDYLYVLLSNTDEANAQKVLDRFRQNGYACELADLSQKTGEVAAL